MVEWFKKYSSILRASIISALEYKANSVVGIFAILTGFFIEYLVWDLIYQNHSTGMIRKMEFDTLIAYIFLSLIIGQLKSSWITSQEMITQIRHGFMNQYIIKPVSFFNYNLMSFIGTNILYYIPYTILIVIISFIFSGLMFSNFIQIPFFILAVIISIYLSYSIYFFIVCFAFWFGEVRAFLAAYNIANFVLAGQIIPLQFFPPNYLNIIKYTPIPYLIRFPVDIAMSEESTVLIWINTIFIALAWCIIMRILGGVLYSVGIKRYEAYGA